MAIGKCGVDHATLEWVCAGIYSEPLGGGQHRMHLCVAEFLAENGFEDNAHNRQVVEEALAEIASERFPGVPIVNYSKQEKR